MTLTQIISRNAAVLANRLKINFKLAVAIEWGLLFLFFAGLAIWLVLLSAKSILALASVLIILYLIFNLSKRLDTCQLQHEMAATTLTIHNESIKLLSHRLENLISALTAKPIGKDETLH
jgi:hypothetical protein